MKWSLAQTADIPGLCHVPHGQGMQHVDITEVLAELFGFRSQAKYRTADAPESGLQKHYKYRRALRRRHSSSSSRLEPWKNITARISRPSFSRLRSFFLLCFFSRCLRSLDFSEFDDRRQLRHIGHDSVSKIETKSSICDAQAIYFQILTFSAIH